MKTTLLILTLNEFESMQIIMPKIKKKWVDEILIIDGGSTDGTIEYAKKNGYKIMIQKGRGGWNAYKEALDQIKTDIVIPFSPDGNSIPELIPSLIDKMKEGYDMVIASRYLNGAKSYDDDMITGFGNRMFTFLINFLYGSNYTDSGVMFRAWKTKIFRELDLDKEKTYRVEEKLFRTKMGAEALLSIRAAKRKLKVGEIPGDEPARIAGKRKMKVIRMGAGMLFEIIREKFCWS